MSPQPSLEHLNDVSPERFAQEAAPLFEGAPRFLARLAEGRPFESFEAMFAAARVIAAEMPSDEQIELLDAHPRIGADPTTVSALSYTEQGYDSDGPAGAAAARRLEALNAAYEQRFGFRFVAFVGGRPRDAIVPLLEVALESERASEIRRGLEDIVSIAEDRLRTLRANRRSPPTIGA